GVIGVEGVRKVVAVLSIPAVAIGGISAENVSQVMTAGVDGVAVISSVVACGDIAGAVRRLVSNMDG
ncbi:MAG: thiamine phosphate synthase, partial [Synergistaceae bacterium]|nr:thiamine phosphate synthase [Synergistaceae bacterium]